MNPSIKAWLELATADLLAAQRLQGDEDLTNISCFHSQQCVEKSLKAFLESRNIPPPKNARSHKTLWNDRGPMEH